MTPGQSRVRASALRRSLTALVALAVLGTAVACGGTDTGGTEPAGPSVTVADMAYQPASLTVRVGETVTWTFDDRGTPHDVSGTGTAEGVLRSPIQASGTFTYTFTEPGTYEYTCTLHPEMQGAVIVTP
ncbi:plastocyanin/azurin family copper-binding protein [Rhodococcus sp. HNM0569]|uniref:cupredoxin domain-containing protein n=1 Tax=Rhodococcus sp. HNM0569 TaxID=2716340 RepID=UPI00146E932E|nr:plastocyanin/azurin family copper-binding protein [Rhodococcus sp. HNM0569]NLU81774.1 copper-binding protein [Rhodococcus sp. HNM0569]